MGILARTVLKRGHTGVYFPEAVITFFGIESYLVLTTFSSSIGGGQVQDQNNFPDL